MGSLSALMNWTAGYLVNDLDRLSMCPHASAREYLLMSQLGSPGLRREPEWPGAGMALFAIMGRHFRIASASGVLAVVMGVTFIRPLAWPGDGAQRENA